MTEPSFALRSIPILLKFSPIPKFNPTESSFSTLSISSNSVSKIYCNDGPAKTLIDPKTFNPTNNGASLFFTENASLS